MITKQTKSQSSQLRGRNTSNDNLKPVINNLPDGYDQLMNNRAAMRSIIQEARDAAEHSDKGIFVRVNHSYQKIKTGDICFIEALSDYLHIYTRDKRYTIHCTMLHLLEKLPQSDFLRVHRSYIVNMDHISAIEDNNVLVVESKFIPIGKTFRHEVMSRLNVFY